LSHPLRRPRTRYLETRRLVDLTPAGRNNKAVNVITHHVTWI
jgi:hypothetical protein